MPSYAIGPVHPSPLNGAPVLETVTWASDNRKTGDMLQVQVITADVSPSLAVRGHDTAVCGDCKHKPTNQGTCYVLAFQAPRSIWQSWTDGRVPTVSHFELGNVVAGKSVRLGSYGDPAAMDPATIDVITTRARRWTGYTHQWQTRADLRSSCMASVDSPDEYRQAKAAGWRTFRVRRPGEPLQATEIVCPASDEAGKRTTCAECGLCNGSRGPADHRKDIAILAHGTTRAPKE